MKKILFGCLLFVLGTAQAQQQNQVVFRLEGLRTPLIIGHYYGDLQYLNDTIYPDTARMQAVFQIQDCQPGMYFAATEGRILFDFMLETCPANFTLGIHKAKPDSVWALNSPENEAFLKFQRFKQQKIGEASRIEEMVSMIQRATNDPEAIKPQIEQITALDKQLGDSAIAFINRHPKHLFAKMLNSFRPPEIPSRINPLDKNGRPNPVYQRWMRVRYFDNVDFKDKRLLYCNLWTPYFDAYMNQLVAPRPDSIISALDRVLALMPKDSAFYVNTLIYLTKTFDNNPWPYADQVFVHLVDKYQQAGKSPWLDMATQMRLEEKAKIHRSTLTGQKSPELKLSDEKGQPFDLHQSTAKYTLLVFYSPLCEHCKAALPDIYQTWIDVRPIGIQGVAVNTDERFEYWKTFVGQQNYEWTDLADPSGKNEFEKPWATFNLPVIYLLDAEKRVLRKRIKPEELRDVLRSVINQN